MNGYIFIRYCTWFPFFVSGKYKTLQIEATKNPEVIGNKSTLVYFPPGYLENPKPTYDVIYTFDLSSSLNVSDNIKPILDNLFSRHLHCQVLIGFGDYKNDSRIQHSTQKDRTNLLTGVNIYLFLKAIVSIVL